MAHQTFGQSPVPWKFRDVALASAMAAAGIFLVVILVVGIGSVFGLDSRYFFTPWLFGIVEGLMLLAAWAFSVKKYGVKWQTLGLRSPKTRGSFALPGLVFVASIGFTAIYAAIVSAFGVDSLQPPSISEDLLGHGQIRVWNALVITLWGPFAEEVFFRGFLLAGLILPLGMIGAAAASSALFAVAHLTPGTLIPIFVTGLLLSWLYLRTGSIWPPVIAHAAQNLTAVLVAS